MSLQLLATPSTPLPAAFGPWLSHDFRFLEGPASTPQTLSLPDSVSPLLPWSPSHPHTPFCRPCYICFRFQALETQRCIVCDSIQGKDSHAESQLSSSEKWRRKQYLMLVVLYGLNEIMCGKAYHSGGTTHA